MTARLDLLGGDTLVVSPTQLEVMRTCAQMWRNRYLYRRVKATADAASQGGRAFDAALNHRYTKLGNQPCDPATEAEMLAIVDKAYEGVELPLEEYRTPARYKEVVQAYNAYWQHEPWEVLGVQVPFAVVLGRVQARLPDYDEDGSISSRTDRYITVVLQGLLDLFVRSVGHVFVIDTKTSKDGDPSRNSYENSAQMKAYCWALPELARQNPTAGLPTTVHGAIINNVIIRPPYKQADRTPRPSDKPRNEFYRTCPEFYTPERLEEWRRDTLLHVETALGWVARDHFPANERHCTFHVDAAFTNYGHYGKPCPYLSVCTLPKGQRAMALATDEFMDYGRGPLGELKEPAEAQT